MFQGIKIKMNIITVLLVVAGLNQRIYGYSNLKPHLVKMIINSVSVIFAFSLYIFVN